MYSMYNRSRGERLAVGAKLRHERGLRLHREVHDVVGVIVVDRCIAGRGLAAEPESAPLK